MSFKLIETDEVFHALDVSITRGLLSDQECDHIHDAAYAAYVEYDRLLEHAKHQRDTIRAYEDRWKRIKEVGMDDTLEATSEVTSEGTGKVPEYPSITDELRDCIVTANRSYEDVRNPYNDREILHIAEEELLRIADRIDERNARDVFEADVSGYSRVLKEVNESYAKLPVDADGKCIHIGDVMEGEKIGGGYGEPFEVVGYAMSNGELEPMDEHKCPRKHKYLRHHHAPTVEDVLREFALAVCKDEALTIRKGVVEEYAAKLQLKDDYAEHMRSK